MIGCLSGKGISFGVLRKQCEKCVRAARSGVDGCPPTYVCTKSHEGSSGSMETKLALKLTVDMFERTKQKINLYKLMSDDDSTMRSLL